MRLHRLELTAFGAFAGHEVVDLDALSDAGLFLLHGDTGAGKTTLLDAICFALYGEVPGARNKDASLRSHHAAADVRTEVVLEATLRGERVRITRSPRQERPKQRGAGTTEEPPGVLVEVVADDGTARPLATRVDEARRELEERVGLTARQFCSVVLLPQGDFATFLRADTKDRHEILDQLFDTRRFADAEGWLEQRRKAAAVELREAQELVRDVVSRLAEVARDEAPEVGPSDPEALRTWANTAKLAAELDATTAGAAAGGARIERERAQIAVQRASALVDRQQTHDQARRALAAVEARAGERAALEAERAAARRAAPVAPLLATATSSGEAARAARVHAQSALAALPALAREGLEPAQGALPFGEQAAPSPDAAGLRAVAGSLRARAGEAGAATEAEARLDDARRERTEQAARAADGRARSARATAALAAAEAARPAAVAAVDAARSAAERLDGLREAARAAARQAEQAPLRDALEVRLVDAEAAVERARVASVEARETWIDLAERRIEGMAAELASSLEPGEPCPVCGAEEHPSPVPHAPDVPRVDAAAERAAGEARERALEVVRRAVEARGAVERDLATAAAVAGAAPAGELIAAARAATAALAEAEAAAGRRAHAEDALARLEAGAAGARTEEAAAATATADAEARGQAADAALADLAARVERARGGHPSIAAHVAALVGAADGSDAAAEAADVAAAAGSRAREALAEAEAASTAGGFADARAAQGAVRDAARLAAIDEAVAAFDEELHGARARAADPDGRAAAEQAVPDLASLRDHHAATAAADDQATGAAVSAEERRGHVGRLADVLEERLVALAPVAEREGVVRELALLVEGSSGANAKRMRLSAYVLAARLEQVAEQASIRLERFSDGRYRLVHSDGGGRGRTRGGLELRVVDNWTGEERAPQSLSGGETFFASLALALGLADVVSHEAGGASLGTLFIDEGFGSLDETTLERVMDVLDGLRDGGRAVGVISHVGELRGRIGAQLHVSKGRTGSHVRPLGTPSAPRRRCTGRRCP